MALSSYSNFHKLHVRSCIQHVHDLFDSTRATQPCNAMQCNARSSAPHDGNSSEQDARTPGDTNVGPRVGRGNSSHASQLTVWVQ